MFHSFDLFGKGHTIDSCKMEDIDGHFSVIERFITDVPEELFKDRMRTCVEAGTAYKLHNNTCFLYYINIEKWYAQGVAINGENNPQGMIALMSGIFDQKDKDTFKIDFKLHPGKPLSEYKSLLTLTSMKRHMTHDDTVAIRVDEFKAKIKRIWKARGLV